MQTYQDKISLDFENKSKPSIVRNIDVRDSISIIEPAEQRITLSPDSINPSPQIMVSPTEQVERGVPETKNQAISSNTYQKAPTNKNENAFMSPSPNNQISGKAGNKGPRFSSETLNSFPPEIKASSPEWRMDRS